MFLSWARLVISAGPVPLVFDGVFGTGKEMNLERTQPEWMDLKALQGYACVSERTLREWIHRASDPLPASRVGTKILIRRTVFDDWLEKHQVRRVDIGSIVDELVGELRATN